MAGPSYSGTKRLSQAHAHEFDIVSQFKLGYRNREDVTNLPPGVLIVGSQNVITNVSDRVQIRQGYTLDGAVSAVQGPVLASFDWLAKNNGEVHMRAGGLTTAGNDGKLQWRYDDGAGNVVWENLLTSLTTVNYNFANYFNTSESIREVLFVNGTSNIFRWNGAHAVIASTTSNTITKTGTEGFVEAGFYQNANRSVRINGNTYTYTGIGNTSTPYTQTPTNNSFTVTGAHWISQLFTTGASASNIIQATVRIHSSTTQTPNAVFAARIYTDNAGVPGTALGGAQATITGPFGAGNNDLTFSFSNIAASALTNYHLVIFSETVNTSTMTAFYGATGSVGTNNSLDTGGTWNAQTGYLYATVTNADTGSAPLQLIGVSPDPTGEANGSVIAQSVVTTANSAMTTIPATFANALIETLNNQVYVGSLTSSALYISKQNDYTDYSLSTPRLTGDGALLVLDQNLTALKPQEQFMYVACGQDLWYNVSFSLQTSAVGVTYEQVDALLLKNGKRQAPISQAFVSHMKNNIIVATLETTIDTFGRIETSLATPQTTNISDPIKLDIDSYDFTDGSIFYWRYYILVAVPKEGIVRIFNLNTKNWEAPQTIPVSRFYIVDGELYGHSYATFESYKLFTGYADRVYTGFLGYPIAANWVFSYQNYGTRFAYKRATKMYVEGYINENTGLTAKLTYDLDGCATVKTFFLGGFDTQFVCIPTDVSSLGKASLGKVKLGGDDANSIQNLPPKFRWFPTFSNTDFFECSISFSVYGIDERAEFLAFGLAVAPSTQIPVQNYD